MSLEAALSSGLANLCSGQLVAMVGSSQFFPLPISGRERTVFQTQQQLKSFCRYLISFSAGQNFLFSSHSHIRFVRCLDVASTHDPSTCSIFFQSRRSYRPAEGRVEAKRRQRPGPPPATTNRLLAEPGGGPGANCAWVEVSRGRFVGGRIVKAPFCTYIHNRHMYIWIQ